MQTMNAIIESINTWGQSFCTFSRTMFVQVTILVVLLLLVDQFLRHRSRISACLRYGLWLLVLVKLVLPPSLALPTGIGYWVRPASSQSAPVPTAVSGIYVPSEPRPSTSPPPRAFSAPTENDARVASTRPEIERIALQWQGGLLLLWLVWVFCLFGLLVHRYVKLRKELRQVQPAPAFVMQCLKSCCLKLRLHYPVTVKLSGTLRSPVVCGFRRPVILLPVSLPERLSPQALEAVLGHELIHVRRRDPWVHLAQSLLQIIYFYHPLVWVANRVTGRVRELAVDEAVLATFKLKVSQYTDTLIGVAEMAYRKPALNVCFVGLAESREVLEGRITHMLQQRSSDRARFGWIGLIIILLIGAVLVPMGQGEPRRRGKPEVKVEAPAPPMDILDLLKLNPHEIPQELGEPQRIFYGEIEYSSLDTLPQDYYLVYEKLSFLVNGDWVSEITILSPEYDFGIFGESVGVGATEAEVRAALGDEGSLKETESKDFLCFDEFGLTLEIDKESRLVQEINIRCRRGDGNLTMLRTKDTEFARLLPQRIAQLDIDHDGLERVRELFGEPQKYGWGPKKAFDPNNLPSRFVAWYPNGFQVCLFKDRIWEVRLEMTQSDYAFMGKIRIGTSLEDVLEVLGNPHEVVTGEELAFKHYVLYRDISGRKGYAYYHRPDHRVRLWFGQNKVAAIYLTNSEDADAETEVADPEFSRRLQERIGQIGIDDADLAEVKRIFGEPRAYVWGDEQFDANELPERFIARYPADFSVFMSGGRIVELRISGKESGFTFLDGIRIGTPLEEAVAIMGKPDEVVQGQKNRFVDGVLYKDIAGRRGHCYYHKSELHARLWFSNYDVHAIYLTRSDYSDGPSSKDFDEAFNRLLPGRIAQLDIDKADRATVEARFGKPLKYVWGNRSFSVDELPKNYILRYPCSFNVWISDDRIKEIRHERGSQYVFAPGVELGASVEDVIAVLGEPTDTVTGKENEYKHNVLYRDIEGNEGHCYYHRPDKQIRVWFSDNELIAIYMTRSDF